jgi:tetratricopeptide (TPR) repeat protein
MAENIPQSESKELIQAKKLIGVSKLDEAEEIIKNFEAEGAHTLYDNVLCHLLNSEILVERGLFEDVVILTEKTYKESLGLGKTLLSVDILLIMVLGLLTLGKFDKAKKNTKECEDLLKTFTKESSVEYRQREVSIAFLNGWNYFNDGNTDQAIKQFELSISLREQLEIKQERYVSLFLKYEHLFYGIAWAFMWKGDYDRALEYSKRGITYSEQSGYKSGMGYLLFLMAFLHHLKGELDRSITYGEQSLAIYKELNNKFTLARILQILGGSYGMKGELDQSIRLYKQSLELFKKFNNNFIMANIFNALSFSYKMKGDLNHALESIEQSMVLFRELEALPALANSYDYLIQILIDRGDLERAKTSLVELEQLKNKLNYKRIILQYRYNKALVLKTSSRALNRGKAEEILKQLLEEKDLIYEARLIALINLCELLLADLQITNEAEVLDEIKPLITQLLNLSEKSHSFWLLGETYLLQAKLALISLNPDEARRLLTQGQKITEKYGLTLLAQKISNEHDQMLKQLEKWEGLKDSKASLAKRIKLSRLNEQIEGMVSRRVGRIPKLKAEQPILLTVNSKEGKIILSNPFTADVTINNTFFSEFLSSCNTFCNQTFSESFDRVKLGQHTMLITAVDSFSICYMFQGQSYSARQKLIHFSETIKKDPNIMKILEDASSKNIEIKVNETGSFEDLIYESFLSDPQQFQMPFEAYEGDEPFVFVSYSHTDRLQVYPIIDYLNKTGKNIWYDEGIPISEDWKKSIVDNLEQCSAFLVFITPHIIDSEYVRKEISFALKKKKPFFSIYLKETELPSELEFEIGNIQFMKKYLIPETEFYNKLNRMLDPVLNK